LTAVPADTDNRAGPGPSMRQLRYTLELPDGSHHEHAAIGYREAEHLVRSMDWKAVADASLGPKPGENADNPFLLFLDEGESFFMVQPEPEGFQVKAQVVDKWNLLGMVSRQKSFVLDFGLVTLDDALFLLKLFFDDNYPALRALEKELGWGGPAGE
jgi:hypothetical protein